MSANKPKFNTKEQVRYLKDKGVTFKYYSEQDAEKFLTESNYFFKLKAFAKNYDKDKDDKYIKLDFAYLREMSILDKLLRDIIFELCLTCEHLLKVQINTHCSNKNNEDGYKIVDDFLKTNKPHSLIIYERSKCNIYQKRLIEKYYIKNRNEYESNFALWNFIEILTFAEFINFYNLYFEQSEELKAPFIKEVKELRNAAAHNFCILHILKDYTSINFKPSKLLQRKIREMNIFNQDKKLKKLKNPIIHDCLCLLFLLKALCPPRMFRIIKRNIISFIRKTLRRKEYFTDNQHISSSFNFVIKVILKII